MLPCRPGAAALRVMLQQNASQRCAVQRAAGREPKNNGADRSAPLRNSSAE